MPSLINFFCLPVATTSKTTDTYLPQTAGDTPSLPSRAPATPKAWLAPSGAIMPTPIKRPRAHCRAPAPISPPPLCSLSPTASALSAPGTSCAPPRARRALALGACLWELPRQPASPARHHCRHRVPRARPPALAASPLVLTVWHDEHEYPAPLPSVPRDFLYNT